VYAYAYMYIHMYTMYVVIMYDKDNNIASNYIAKSLEYYIECYFLFSNKKLASRYNHMYVHATLSTFMKPV